MHLSVNYVLENLRELEGRDISVFGVLNWEFEDYSISHLPLRERKERPDDCPYYNESSIWLEVGMGALSFNHEVLEKWNGKSVVIQGQLYGPSPGFEGCGHFSGWPALILARSIERE